MKIRRLFIIMLTVVVAGCASSNQKSYKPKYKKVDLDKPLPCPLKDC